jgi:hypothetical protein
MAATFDRSRPYGSVFGDLEGRMYEQDGQFFRGDGSLWTPPATADAVDAPAAKATPKASAKKAAADPAPATVDAQLDAQMGNP